MAFTALNYTVGDWTVNQKTIDTPTTLYPNATKTITVANMNWSKDYSTKSEDVGECDVINVTGTTLTSDAICRCCYKEVKDVYNNTNLVPSKLANRAGVQVMVSLEELFSSKNSKTGEEGDLPVVGWLCLRLPTHPSSTTALLQGAMERILGALFATDDATNETLISNIIRQKLNPTE